MGGEEEEKKRGEKKKTGDEVGERESGIKTKAFTEGHGRLPWC